MFEEKKQQFIKSRETLELTLEEKKKTREILEERRKRDEETFLKPIIEKEDKEKKVLKEKKMELIEFLKQQLQIFYRKNISISKYIHIQHVPLDTRGKLDIFLLTKMSLIILVNWLHTLNMMGTNMEQPQIN